MTTKTTELKHTLSQLPAEADGDLVHKICNALNSWIYREPGLVGLWRRDYAAEPDSTGFFLGLLGLTNKASYLEFRELLKAHLRFFSADQKRLALLMREPGGDPQAQCRHAQHAELVTSLIEIRRAGKVWSAAQAAAARAAAA